ncbi:helix-turn-helix transcriptional regulator [Clostridium sp. JN-1]|uniref:helix-turn-helix domain-containing protein n=1 Tax=Clostridium sp. JN-1 TaxID=2483110 RepID=UPI000F0B19BD|nr:helix-turn-helix transcriptional regulator [Clostridium sp. JN-1]
MATFNQRMKKLRNEKNVTLEELSKALNTTKSTLSRYENNLRTPNADFINQLANYYNVSTDYLLGNSDDRTLSAQKKDTPVEKISKSLDDDPELSEFWNLLKEREDLKLLFKQTKNMDSNDIKKIIRIIKAIEDEEDRNDG